MRGFVASFTLAFLLPLTALAATTGLPAGFAPTSVFASKTNIATGDTISLFTVLYNQSDNDLTGDVVFTVDGTAIGTKQFSLQSGETQTPSLTWTAAQGTHEASAHLENIVGSSDAQISLINDKADTVELTVAPPPPPSPQAQAVQNITNIVTTGSQAAAPAAQTAFNSLENLRQNAVNTLRAQLGVSGTSTAPKGSVLGAETYRAPADAAPAGGSGILGTLWRGILQGLLYVCQIQILFYIVLLIVLYVIYKLIRAVFAERH